MPFVCYRCGADCLASKTGSFGENEFGFFCNDCRTDEEEDSAFDSAHLLKTGHLPYSNECHCFDGEE